MTVIQVENLGKKYTIGHQKGTRYQTLRDTLAHTGRGIMQRLRHPLSPNRESVDLEEIWALRDVNFEIKQGERVGIIGRNGAGKSTLLKILSRITHPTTGRVTITGRVASLLEVGTGFHPELSGRENIYLNGAILGMTRQEIKRKFDEIVAFAEVEKFLDTPVKHYSSGMYVRLAFAVAAHLEPEILVVDEVLAVGDAEFQKKCLGKMEEVAKGGRTVLFVSHNMGAIRQFCGQGILLTSGRLQKIGSTEVVVAAYLTSKDYVQSGERVWDDPNMPGDHAARVKSIRLCAEDGSVRTEFGTTESIYIKVEMVIFQKAPNFRLGISLFTSDGTCIFYSSDADAQERYGMGRLPGQYTCICHIPAYLLNVGSYFIAIGGGIYGVRTIFKNLPELRFIIHATGGPASLFPDEKRAGLIAPNLLWEVIVTPE